MTWSIVEQGIGIVCACLPTLRPLMGYITPSRIKSNTKNSDSIGMDKYRSATVRSDVGTGAKSPWKPTYDSESTVGFARLQDEEHTLSPIQVQQSVYAPIGRAVTTSSAQELEENNGRNVAPGRILKEQTIEQRSEVIR